MRTYRTFIISFPFIRVGMENNGSVYFVSMVKQGQAAIIINKQKE